MIKRAASAADLGINAHAHMLRLACGYKLANDGHDTRAIQAYFGHRNIQNTTRGRVLFTESVNLPISRNVLAFSYFLASSTARIDDVLAATHKKRP